MDEDSVPNLGLPPDESARSVFLAWEKLRVVYNVVLAAVVLAVVALVLGWRFMGDGTFRAYLFQSALVANLCFCVGPVAEGYLAMFGADRECTRILLFSLGTVVSCMFAIGAILFWGMPIFP